MEDKKIIRLYLLIVFSIIVPTCGIVLVLNVCGIQLQSSPYGLIPVAVGGLSTAFAGAFIAKRSGKINSYIELIKDFFRIKQPTIYYIITVSFLLFIFGSRILQGQLREGQNWLDILWIFIMSILFGGIEEIGWRYLFQPILEKKLSFFVASIITFALWGVWHLMFNVLDGSIFNMHTVSDIIWFLLFLMGASYILGSIYNVTKSLWLCVFYHALLNAFSQVFIGTTFIGNVMILAFSIASSVLLVLHKSKITKLIEAYSKNDYTH